jgi:long-subunit fatty acid transport protein
MEDRIVDTEQTGNGFTPVIGLNFSPNEDWNIGLKYEMKTVLTLDNKPKEENNYDLWGKSVDNDIPGIFTAGIGYKGLDWLEAQLSYNLFFDKGVDWGKNVNDIAVWGDLDQTKIRNREIDNNFCELGLGLQFNLNENFAISIGGLRSKSGISKSWQNDLSFSNSAYTMGGGLMWKITERFVLDAGVSNTFYQDDKVEFEYPSYPDLSGNPITSYTNIYGKTTLNLAVGISYSIF